VDARVYREHEHPLDQGDILEAVPFLRRRLATLNTFTAAGVVMSHGCECEGFERLAAEENPNRIRLETYPVHLAPIYPPDNIEANQPGILGDIAKGRVRRYFLLPAEDGHPEAIVDFYYEQPVPASMLTELNRRGSLTEEAWLRLMAHLFAFRTRLVIDPADTRAP
jgi:hypothetical protein